MSDSGIEGGRAARRKTDLRKMSAGLGRHLSNLTGLHRIGTRTETGIGGELVDHVGLTVDAVEVAAQASLAMVTAAMTTVYPLLLKKEAGLGLETLILSKLRAAAAVQEKTGQVGVKMIGKETGKGSADVSVTETETVTDAARERRSAIEIETVLGNEKGTESDPDETGPSQQSMTTITPKRPSEDEKTIPALQQPETATATAIVTVTVTVTAQKTQRRNLHHPQNHLNPKKTLIPSNEKPAIASAYSRSSSAAKPCRQTETVANPAADATVIRNHMAVELTTNMMMRRSLRERRGWKESGRQVDGNKFNNA